MCRARCFTSFLCMLKDLPHSSQVNTFSAVCVFLCSFRLLKLLNPAGARQVFGRSATGIPVGTVQEQKGNSFTSAADVTQVWLLPRVDNDVALDVARGRKPATRLGNAISSLSTSLQDPPTASQAPSERPFGMEAEGLDFI